MKYIVLAISCHSRVGGNPEEFLGVADVEICLL